MPSFNSSPFPNDSAAEPVNDGAEAHVDLERGPTLVPAFKGALCRDNPLPGYLVEPPAAGAPSAERQAYRELADAAIAQCQLCPVLAMCRAFALQSNEVGIWGGMTEVQRKKTRPRRVPLPAPHERILLDELDAKIMVSAYLLSRGVMNGTGFDKDTIAREYGLSGKTVERRRRKALEQLTSMSKAEHSQLLRTLGADKFGLTA